MLRYIFYVKEISVELYYEFTFILICIAILFSIKILHSRIFSFLKYFVKILLLNNIKKSTYFIEI